MTEITFEELKKMQPLNAPKCECFDYENDFRVAMERSAEIVELASTIGALMLMETKKHELCKAALPFVLDTFIIVWAAHIATTGTIIERGSKEARWETERVLTGMEERLLRVLAQHYEASDRLGLTEAKVKAMREGRKS